MSINAVEFVEEWASENIKADGPPPADIGAAAKALAAECLEAARAEGIPQSEIEETFDDLAAFMAAQIEEAHERQAGELDDEADEDE